MRETLVKSLLKLASIDESLCVLTGDLGFALLEPIRDMLGERFINAGIAEQNMISVAAGLCKSGLHPWVYSISPFCYARPFEQVRNDICLNNLPVKIIGSGGGFGYGVAGPTHHAIEDCGVMSSLRNMCVYVPSFATDLEDIVNEANIARHPCYIRLARDETPDTSLEKPKFKPFRKIAPGGNGLIIALGAMASVAWHVNIHFDEDRRPSVWACSKLPCSPEDICGALARELTDSKWVLVLEDHVKTGGLGQQLAAVILESGISVKSYLHRYVKGYISGLYGSQEFHRKENQIDHGSIVSLINSKLDSFCVG
jgi:transketolase